MNPSGRLEADAVTTAGVDTDAKGAVDVGAEDVTLSEELELSDELGVGTFSMELGVVAAAVDVDSTSEELELTLLVGEDTTTELLTVPLTPVVRIVAVATGVPFTS